MLNIDRKTNFWLIILTHQLCSCLCETFLHEGILDSEVQIPGFIIVRSDRVSRPRGGVCLYLRKKFIYKICLKYSNSVCDLLIVKILSQDLIIILAYRPPSSPLSDFDDINTKTREFILSLSAPLPNLVDPFYVRLKLFHNCSILTNKSAAAI